jgi:hypothetical protein
LKSGRGGDQHVGAGGRAPSVIRRDAAVDLEVDGPRPIMARTRLIFSTIAG